MAADRLVIAVALCGAAFLASAQDLGVRGNTWPIKEQDAIEQIKGKLSSMEKSGEMKRLWEKHRDQQLRQIEDPEPVPGIQHAAMYRVRTFDPTFTFGEDVSDHLGNVIAKAGQRVNPLQYTPLTKALLFIDGRDPGQVAMAKKRLDENPRDKIILVAGSFLKLNREWGRPTYFDQRGHLSTRLGIKSVPSLVYQQGSLLRIEEIPVSGGSK